MENVGIYIHVPFCVSKCAYCNFYSLTDKTGVEGYIKALFEELEESGRISADSVFFGGGTPTVLGYDIINILNKIKLLFSISKDAEITIEGNPETVTFEMLRAYREAGINRISFGVQSFCDNELALLLRRHTAKKAADAVTLAKKAGFSNINIDLMLGIPNQTKESLIFSIDEALKLDVTHISIYSLKLEKGTPLFNRKYAFTFADEEEEWEMYKGSSERLSEKGFIHYEISNFAKEGFYCRHNIKYWTLGDYLGFGPSAHSYFKNQRFFNKSSLEEYLKKKSRTSDMSINRLEEYIMLGLRLKEGIDLKKVIAMSSTENSERLYNTADRLVKNNLAKRNNDTLSLTKQGFWVSNSIINEIISRI